MEQRTGSKLGKLCQGYILSPCLFNFYAEYIMQNDSLDESQTEIKIAGRNINNLGYADDIILMAESEEELKNLLIKVKEESEKADLKLNIQKTKILVSGLITLWQTEGEKVEPVGAPKSLWTVTAAMKLKDSCSLERKAMTNIDSILNSRNITLPTKVHTVKDIFFPVILYGCES